MSDAAVNVNPEHHLGWVLVTDLANKANLASGDIGPVFAGTLLDLQKLVRDAQRVKLLAKLFGVAAIVGVRGVKTADDYVSVTHG